MNLLVGIPGYIKCYYSVGLEGSIITRKGKRKPNPFFFKFQIKKFNTPDAIISCME